NGDISDDERKVLSLLRNKPDITAKQMSEETEFSTRKISRIVKKLREEGKIIRIGSNKKGYWEIKYR
ncbi:MAG: winged helix-turn-helix transcriptional regulator, partial [Eubacteriales bacterium]|nr:winged helix-turn-helix transcriptional regulator [Eubacteriales bacterium]